MSELATKLYTICGCAMVYFNANNESPMMSTGYKRPPTPAAVELRLRQESGFGCAKCGHPYIEYHHIIPYAKEKHFRPEDMVALCGNCHPMVSKLQKDRQYGIKENPFNSKKGILNGALEYDKRDLRFKLGGNWYENVDTLIQYGNIPLVSCRILDDQARISINLLDAHDNLVLSIEDNEVAFRVNDVWDFEYNHNFARVRRGKRDIALSIDFRKKDAVIQGAMWANGKRFKFGAKETTFPNAAIFEGNTFSNSSIGIMI